MFVHDTAIVERIPVVPVWGFAVSTRGERTKRSRFQDLVFSQLLFDTLKPGETERQIQTGGSDEGTF